MCREETGLSERGNFKDEWMQKGLRYIKGGWGGKSTFLVAIKELIEGVTEKG